MNEARYGVLAQHRFETAPYTTAPALVADPCHEHIDRVQKDNSMNTNP